MGSPHPIHRPASETRAVHRSPTPSLRSSFSRRSDELRDPLEQMVFSKARTAHSITVAVQSVGLRRLGSGVCSYFPLRECDSTAYVSFIHCGAVICIRTVFHESRDSISHFVVLQLNFVRSRIRLEHRVLGCTPRSRPCRRTLHCRQKRCRSPRAWDFSSRELILKLYM